MLGLTGCGAQQTIVTVEYHADGPGAISSQVQPDDHRPIGDHVPIGDLVPDFAVTVAASSGSSARCVWSPN